MVFSQVVNGEFRVMKAQGVEGVCLSCYGKNIAKEVKDEIKKYYPNDNATGYSLGQIRGTFRFGKKL